MSVEPLRERLTAQARAFAWDQWSQMGVSGNPPTAPERRAADPEALLLFTLEIGRHDPRLFDEMLDWLIRNEPLISVQRLRNLCLDATDRALVESALGSVGQWRPRPRLSSRNAAPSAPGTPEPLFFGLSVPRSGLEVAFDRNGLLRPAFAPSRKSQSPQYLAPINLAFRLRRFLGVGARAEVVRALLTIDAPRATAGVVQASAAFTKPNVREALTQLQDAGLAVVRGVGTELFYSLQRSEWARLLGIEEAEMPRHEDWIQRLGPLRLVLRWLYAAHPEDLSEYMRASEARALLARVEPELRFAGVAIDGTDTHGAAFWSVFSRTTERLAAALTATPID